MLFDFRIFAFIVACIAVVAAVPAPTHKHKDCNRNFFWWGRKNYCLPYGGIRGVLTPGRHHCGRWYWHTTLGYCVPPQPDWDDPQCPAGWRWDDGAYSCLPATPTLPGPGQCNPSHFWWEAKSFCLITGGPSPLPIAPNGWRCPNNWYWHGNGYCAPRAIGYCNNPVCHSSFLWDPLGLYCKPRF
ncbi:unnamed protein product [Rhizoctonia solani]|uniref:Uncharacterized protein n=1 Tax=Rhizoctonia solani TaxID=456999 RepID=A0A8H2XRU0_9AGAM|nr:unnamed protein product [Rhizoctonia solani]